MDKVNQYIKKWATCGYPEDIPDVVPDAIMRLGLAPSYKAIAIAILKNDLQFLSLGFQPKHSNWYSALKKVEIEQRTGGKGFNLELF